MKLSRDRVDSLLADEQGERFDLRHNGKVMKEWMVVKSTSEREWMLLAKEAMDLALTKA